MQRIEVQTRQQSELIPITDEVQQVVARSGVDQGTCYVYVPHTTAGLCINESADPMVAHDVLHLLDRIIPRTDPGYRHREGNSAAHAKAILCGSSEILLVEKGRLVLGTWQGLFFCEFDGPRHRHACARVTPG